MLFAKGGATTFGEGVGGAIFSGGGRDSDCGCAGDCAGLWGTEFATVAALGVGVAVADAGASGGGIEPFGGPY